MQVIGVDHVTIRVPPEQVETLRGFYEDSAPGRVP